MECDEVRKRIYPLLDDELETETNIEVLSHLNVCDRCQEKFEAERNFLQEISDALTDRSVPEDVREDIQHRLEQARENRSGSPWMRRGKTWDNMMSAAVFLLLVLSAGLLSNYFPLHRSSSAEEVIRTFPKYHQEVVSRQKEHFSNRVQHENFKTLDEVKDWLVRKFPEFRERLQVPSLRENQCEVLDVDAVSMESFSFDAPHFHVMYCYLGDRLGRIKEHEGVMLVGVKRADIDLDGISELERVEGSDTFYVTRDDGRDTHCVFWKNDTFVMSMITDGLSRDHLIDLAQSARDEMSSVTGLPSTGN